MQLRLRRRGIGAAALALAGVAALIASPLEAATDKGCEGGGFTVRLSDGTTLRPDQRADVPQSRLGATVQVRGRYVEFDVDTATLGIRNYTFTGAANAVDITGGRRTVVFASKTPDLRGSTLTDPARIEVKEEGLEILRKGRAVKMKIQAKDCANGGLFQMEPEREDGTATRITHTLAPGVFYFDNPNFRAREGDVLPYKDTTVTVTPRVNFGNDLSSKFVGRDSPQVATRVLQGCPNPIRKRDGSTVTVDHCGGVSVWDVASGGRMGAVFGQDATEVAPPATACTQRCQAQNQVQGRAVVLGFPFPIPTEVRFQPRFP